MISRSDALVPAFAGADPWARISATLHAEPDLSRLPSDVPEAARALIAQAIDLIVFIAGRGPARRVETIAVVEGLTGGDYRLRSIDAHSALTLVQEGPRP